MLPEHTGMNRKVVDSLRRLIDECCPGAKSDVQARGNLTAAVAFLHGMALEDLEPGSLDRDDPEYPLVVTARVTRGGAA